MLHQPLLSVKVCADKLIRVCIKSAECSWSLHFDPTCCIYQKHWTSEKYSYQSYRCLHHNFSTSTAPPFTPFIGVNYKHQHFKNHQNPSYKNPCVYKVRNGDESWMLLNLKAWKLKEECNSDTILWCQFNHSFAKPISTSSTHLQKLRCLASKYVEQNINVFQACKWIYNEIKIHTGGLFTIQVKINICNGLFWGIKVKED